MNVWFLGLCVLSWVQQFICGCFHECCHITVSDCQDLLDIGHTTSGVYHVTPQRTRFGFEVYCDMDTDGGGWLVFQRRQNGTENFNRTWTDYEDGFGDVSQEHWLGFVALKRILDQGHYELRIDLEDWDGQTRYAKYNDFDIGSPKEMYELKAIKYSGDAGNALIRHNGFKFSTIDSDNDVSDGRSCAETHVGAWWYRDCKYASLNGVYRTDNPTTADDGITWKPWKGHNHSLKKTEMKIRKV